MSNRNSSEVEMIGVLQQLEPVLTAANQEWALDFVHDGVASGRVMRVLSVMDAYTRECLALEVDTSFASRRVTRVLEQIVVERGVPGAIRCDKGPELTSRHFLVWRIERRIELVHFQPGRPMQNGHVESFNGKLRDECLNLSWFEILWDARRKIAAWQEDYNEAKPLPQTRRVSYDLLRGARGQVTRINLRQPVPRIPGLGVRLVAGHRRPTSSPTGFCSIFTTQSYHFGASAIELATLPVAC